MTSRHSAVEFPTIAGTILIIRLRIKTAGTYKIIMIFVESRKQHLSACVCQLVCVDILDKSFYCYVQNFRNIQNFYILISHKNWLHYCHACNKLVTFIIHHNNRCCQLLLYHTDLLHTDNHPLEPRTYCSSPLLMSSADIFLASSTRQ